MLRWRGEWEGKAYEDKGKVLEIEPGQHLVHTHFSPLGGREDAPENYHTLTWTLADDAAKTRLTLSQDNNDSPGAAVRGGGGTGRMALNRHRPPFRHCPKAGEGGAAAGKQCC